MATKKQSKYALGEWEKVFVFGGEPWNCEQGVNSAIRQYDSRVIRFTRFDSCDLILSSLNKINWEEETEVVVLTNPTADQLKVCYACVVPGPISPLALIINTPGDTLDGRSAFASKAKAANRVWYFDFPEANNPHLITQHIKGWEKDTGIQFTNESKKWLAEHAPTKLAKVKTAKGKTELEVFNILELENELDKIIAISEAGDTVDIEATQSICCFEQSFDVWKFINAVQKEDKQFILHCLDNMNLTNTNQGGLWLLANQLGFLMTVKSLAEKKLNESSIVSALSNPKFAGKYLNQDWTQPEKKDTPEANPWRVSRAIQSLQNIKAKSLADKYCATVNAIKDLRGGMDADIIIPYLTLAFTGKLEYFTCLRERE